jgi:hypothetical protein
VKFQWNSHRPLLIQVESLMNEGSEDLAKLDKGKTAIVAAFLAFLTLFPQTLAIVSGIRKGALKLGQLMPSNPLTTYVVIAACCLEVPLMSPSWCLLMQLGGNWWFFVGFCFLGWASVFPVEFKLETLN